MIGTALLATQLHGMPNCQEDMTACDRIVCLGNQGWYFEAMSLVAQGEVWECSSADAIYHLSKALASQQRYEESLKQLERLFALHPDDERYSSALAQVLHLQSTPPLPMVLSLPEGQHAGGSSIPGWVKDKKLVYINEVTETDVYFPYKEEKRTFLIDSAYWKENELHERVAMQIHKQGYSYLGPGLQFGDTLLCFTASHHAAFASAKNVDELSLHWIDLTEKSIRPKAWIYHEKGYHSAFPAIDDAKRRLVFSTNRPGGAGGMDLWYADWEAGQWAAPRPFSGKVNSNADEVYADVQGDTLFFASNRDDLGLGGFDIYGYCMSRDSLWNLRAPVNSSADDYRFIQVDKGEAYIASNRPTMAGGDKVWRIQWAAKEEFFEEINGQLSNTQLTAGTEVRLIDEASGMVLRTVVEADGSFRFRHVKGLSDFRIELPETEVDEGAKLTLSDAEGNTLKEVVSNKGGFKFVLLSPLDYEMERLGITDSGTMDIESLLGLGGRGKPAAKSIQLFDHFDQLLGSALSNESGQLVYSPVAEDALVKVHFDTIRLDQDVHILDNSGRVLATLQADYNGEGLDIKLPQGVEELVISNDQLYLIREEGTSHYAKGTLHYEQNGFELGEAHEHALLKIADLLHKHPDLILELEGHTDARGTDAYNQKLSTWRVEEAMRFLNATGIEMNRMSAKAFGEQRPLYPCAEEECSPDELARNRRTEFWLKRRTQ